MCCHFGGEDNRIVPALSPLWYRKCFCKITLGISHFYNSPYSNAEEKNHRHWSTKTARTKKRAIKGVPRRRSWKEDPKECNLCPVLMRREKEREQEGGKFPRKKPGKKSDVVLWGWCKTAGKRIATKKENLGHLEGGQIHVKNQVSSYKEIWNRGTRRSWPSLDYEKPWLSHSFFLSWGSFLYWILAL